MALGPLLIQNPHQDCTLARLVAPTTNHLVGLGWGLTTYVVVILIIIMLLRLALHSNRRHIWREILADIVIILAVIIFLPIVAPTIHHLATHTCG